MRRLVCALSVALAVAAASADRASGAIFFVMKPNAAVPGERVDVRTPWTRATFTYARAKRPFHRVTLYLVRNSIAGRVKSPSDRRLARIGTVTLDAEQRGFRSFVVPRLAPGTYTTAYWCPRCGPRKFTSFTARRSRMLLQVRPNAGSDVVAALRDAGLELRALGTFASDLFGDVPFQRYESPGGPVLIWQFADDERAREAASYVSPGGYDIRGPGRAVHVDWIGPPHWFRQGRAIVLYLGRHGPTLAILRRVLGPQFAGQ
jgi:hypothetical protein